MKTILDVEIEDRANKLAKLEPGTQEYRDTVDGLTKLMDRRIKMEELEMAEVKAEADRELAVKKFEADKELEAEKLALATEQAEKQASEERKSRIWKMLIDAGLGVAGIGVTIWGAKASFKFEETGTITTQTGKKLMDRIFRK